MRQTPKRYRDDIRLRRQEEGSEQRRNLTKVILERGTPLPKPVQYEDIDQEMFDWVDKKFNLVYNGTRLPTYKLYSTQRISEYSQSWSQLDDTGNIIMNFKTVTREVNPVKGELNGSTYNIPTHRDYAVFYVPVLQDNGTDAYDKYTMKQPFSVNLRYEVSVVTNKMEVLNRMNEAMHYEFSSIYTYVFPNGHPMSLSMEDISDNSEYAIDDRRFYSQTFKLKLKAYVIRPEDFSVERVPSRIVIGFDNVQVYGKTYKRKRNIDKENRVQFITTSADDTQGGQEDQRILRTVSRAPGDDGTRTVIQTLSYSDEGDSPTVDEAPVENVTVDAEVLDNCDGGILIDPVTDDKEGYDDDEVGTHDCQEPEKDERYKNVAVSIVINYDDCTNLIEFESGMDVIVTGAVTENVYDFKVHVNGEYQRLTDEIHIMEGDRVSVEITKDNPYDNAVLRLTGYDPERTYDSWYEPESELDEPVREEEIVIG